MTCEKANINGECENIYQEHLPRFSCSFGIV